MLDVNEVLLEKENQLNRVRREVEALRRAVEILGEPGDPEATPVLVETNVVETNVEAAGGQPVRSNNTVSMRLKRLAAPLLASIAR